MQSARIGCVTILYIRDVSDEVAERLRKRAAAEGKWLSSFVAGELSRIAAGSTDAEMVARLKARDRSSGPTSDEIVAEGASGSPVMVVDALARVEALVELELGDCSEKSMRSRPGSRQRAMNPSTSGRPCIRHRVSCALQNRFRTLSVHNEQNGNRRSCDPEPRRVQSRPR